MSVSDLSAKKKSLRREVWTQEWLERRQACRIAGDQRGVERINFGRYLKMIRLAANLTQAQASKALKELRTLEEARKGKKPLKPGRNREPQAKEIERQREEWRSWESAVHLPKDVTILRIAAILDGDPAAFLRQGGRPIPKQLLVYDEAWATRTFRRKLRDARSFVQLVDAVQGIWQKYTFEQTGARAHIEIDHAYSQVLEMVYLYLSEKQQIKLARQLVRKRNDEQLEKHVKDAFELCSEVEKRFKALPTSQISLAVNDALEEIAILPGRFDGVKDEMRDLLETLAMRDQEPITEPGEFIYRLMEHFEVIRQFEQELIVIDEKITLTATKMNSALKHTLTKKAEVLELLFQLCEMFAKLQRRVATLMDPPQKILDRLENALENQQLRSKRKRPRLSGTRRDFPRRGDR
jgi:transcriptional regulator with XRE-family HTH domain